MEHICVGLPMSLYSRSGVWRQAFLWLCRDRKLFPQSLAVTSAKTGMKELFAQPKMKKDGTASKVCVCTPQHRDAWFWQFGAWRRRWMRIVSIESEPPPVCRSKSCRPWKCCSSANSGGGKWIK